MFIIENYVSRQNVECWTMSYWALSIVGIILALFFGLRSGENLNTVPMGAISSNGNGCAEIGGSMLEVGGSAIDAAIATLLCEGVVLPHSLGVGGGFVATIFSKGTGRVETLIARESAPAAATQDMFVMRNITGAIATAVPSEIYGYWRLHEKYGKLPWRDLFMPAIELCRNGIVVSDYFANVLDMNADRIRKEVSMSEVFIDPCTNEVYKTGDVIYFLELGDTLEIIAYEGADVIYRGGRIGKWLVEDIQAMGGIITEEDLENYDVRWEEPLLSKIGGGYQLYTTPLPTSGAVLTFILNVMAPLYTTDHNQYWQRLIETFKHAYGHRTGLGDEHFEPEVREIYEQLIDPKFAEKVRALIHDDYTINDISYYGANFSNVDDHGTAHISVLAPNGDAISVTSTVNSHFGAKVRSRRTGIILNDQMDDFSTPGVTNTYGIPASPANYIKPGKLPMSSTCPSIVLDEMRNVKLIVGGAGGSRITTSVAQAILRYLVLREPLDTAVNVGRIHHQLVPMHVDIEPEVSNETVDYLSNIGHTLSYLPKGKAYSALTAIGLLTDTPQPIYDRRRMGSAVVCVKNPE